MVKTSTQEIFKEVVIIIYKSYLNHRDERQDHDTVLEIQATVIFVFVQEY